MGNTSSKGDGSSATHSPTDSKAPSTPSHQQKDKQTQQSVKRRESVPNVSHTRTAAPPSATLESAHASPTSQITSDTATSSTRQHVHSRQRSQTSVDPSNKPYNSVARDHGGPSTRNSDKAQPSHGRGPSPLSATSMQASAVQSSEDQSHNTPTQGPTQTDSEEAVESIRAGTSPSNYYIPNAQYNRPPRMPLPIEEEVLIPGSPIMSPEDFSGPIGGDIEDENELTRTASIRSSTTADEDEVTEDEFQAHGRVTGQVVDTLVEWKEGGDRVYVTGSFSGWNKKHRLQKNGPSRDPNAFSALVPLVVGAHHMTFLVDGQMRTSKFLPTAVDYTNVLINYIEIAPSDAHRPSAPVDIQRPNQNQQAKPPTTESHHRPPPSRDAGQMLPPPTPDLKPTHKSGIPSAGPSIASSAVPLSGAEQQPARHTSSSMMRSHASGLPRRVADTKDYHNEIPPFLVDLDAPEDSHRFARANATMETQPQPPALPTFLTKSILNGTLPMKDDASVLVMPNHTVLNHMATTSIKSKILATSATTRYKRKYVTTILYKPTNEHGS